MGDREKRLEAAGGGELTEKLKERLRKKEMDLKRATEDLEGRVQEKQATMLKGALEVGASVFGSLFGGRRGSALSTIRKGASAMGGVSSKNRMEDNAEARVQSLKDEVAGLQDEIAGAADVDPARFEQKTVAPTKTSMKLLRYDIVWVY